MTMKPSFIPESTWIIDPLWFWCSKDVWSWVSDIKNLKNISIDHLSWDELSILENDWIITDGKILIEDISYDIKKIISLLTLTGENKSINDLSADVKITVNNQHLDRSTGTISIK